MTYTSEDTIFVQIPCYRDSELQWTLKDLFEKAKRPENIFCGIFFQIDLLTHEDDDLDYMIKHNLPRQEQLRILKQDYREVSSICKARSLAQDLIKNEKYILEIDSHMRFKKNWDEILVNEHKYLMQTKKYKAVALTQRPGSYELNSNELNFETGVFRIGAVNVSGYKLTRYGILCEKINCNDICITSATCGAFIFYNIINDNYLRINPKVGACDELFVSLLLFTNKYNIYLLNKLIVNHLNNNTSYMKDKNFARARSQGHKMESESETIMSIYLNIEKTKDLDILQNIKKYPLGTKRTLRDYERFSGIDFRKKIMKEHSKQGIFEEWQEVGKIKEIKNLFNNKVRLCYGRN